MVCLLCVVDSHVSVCMSRHCKCLIKHVTLVWFLSCAVNSSVLNEPSSVMFHANVTCESSTPHCASPAGELAVLRASRNGLNSVDTSSRSTDCGHERELSDDCYS